MIAALASTLDEEELEWRENTILMMDGARYHKTKEVQETLLAL